MEVSYGGSCDALFGRYFFFLQEGAANGAARKGKQGKWARIHDRLCRSCFIVGMYVQVIPFLCLEFIGISGEEGGNVRPVWYALYGIDDHCQKFWFGS